MTKKLAFVVTEDWYFWSHRAALARAAMKAGFEVTVVTRPGRFADKIRAQGMRLEPWSVSRSGVNPLVEIGAVRRLAVVLRRVAPDVVHNVALKPVLYGGLAARLAGCTRVVSALAGLGHLYASPTAKARLLRGPLRAMLSWLLRGNGQQIIAQNPDDFAWLKGLGLSANQLHLVRGAGVDLDVFAPSPEPQGTVVASMVSRMLRAKGVLQLVEAASLLRERGAAMQVHLVGPPDPGNPDSLSVDELKALESDGLVHWLGSRDDIPAVWRDSHIAVLPSYYAEGLPKSLLEAAASGRPIVATDMPGVREIARHNETGLLVPPRDAVALADAIERLVRDPTLRSRLGKRGRELVAAEFSDRLVIDSVLSIYANLLHS